MARPFGKHIDNTELNALVPWGTETGHELHELADDVSEAERHARSCVDCNRKVSKYWRLVNRLSNMAVSETPRGTGCPTEGDVDWPAVAAGLWPESKTARLILHAALCDHCGPLLRAATSVDDDPTPQRKNFLEKPKALSRSDSGFPGLWPPPLWPFAKWLIPVAALVVIVGVVSRIPFFSSTSLSGPRFAEFAVSTHRQYAQGKLALDIRSDSQQVLNAWFKAKSQFALILPASARVPDEVRPYRPEGARFVRVGSKTAAFIAYQAQTSQPQAAAVSLMVTPVSLAVASGGAELHFNKVRFHYARIDSYKVVTWSVHGLTYALVSQEGNGTQRSCMVCHSAMRDRDLSRTPTPLRNERDFARRIEE